MRLIVCAVAIIVPCPALACSICGTMATRVALAQQFEQANVVAYGHVANPKLNADGIGGKTEFHIDKIVKDHPAFPRNKMIVLSRYLPVLDAKDPPRYAMFFRVPGKTTEPYHGQSVTSPAVLEFVARLATYHDNPAQRLHFAAKHLDDADPLVAEEAFLAFAQGDDKVISQVAKDLPAPMLRKLVKAPDLDPERLGMYAYLLGACGTGDDVETFRTLLKNPTPRNFRAYDGIVAGYITLRPQEGWAFAHEMLRSPKNDFTLRYAVLRAMRFFYNANPEANGTAVMTGEGLAIAHADVADVAIRDLMAWKRWDHTKAIVAAYDNAKSPIVKNGIIRYALACPLAEAKTFVERARREDAKNVKYLEEELK